ncbi:MAG: Single-stranded-DNA-specific exonuclease RecJ [Candidatus Gallionella acididurans]|uniref:Single-stranded-DNA-specific exonuclease RecJ n=1 Tax=Candidatus Gallionella acididurans TaxID=1796491 RepID=A0A139BRQ1_9PROT|nr:MAG: Single-stranded-DNA-specific exonuclease RecJ [Candidatus Gallionella acididurans]
MGAILAQLAEKTRQQKACSLQRVAAAEKVREMHALALAARYKPRATRYTVAMPEITTRNFPPDAVQHLRDSSYPPALARIFAARGITDSRQLDTTLAGLLPFDALKNAGKMACLLADAITARKRLVVIADYDADGATACAVAVRGLRSFGAQVDFIVPNRFEYGYGLTPEIVHLAAKGSPHSGGVPNGVPFAGAFQSRPDILVTVDNGIASVEGVAEANRLGMQVLVTDHHLPGDRLPDAACIVNPNQPGCAFPSKNLAGVGVMFYVLLALRAELRARGAFATQAEPRLAELLDLVALGTVADVVRLDQNNRTLVQQGLLRIRAGRACAGINALLQAAKKDPARTSSQDLGFTVGPRLNAAGRLDDMSLGINCLLTDDAATATQIAARLDALNRERRSIETGMQDSALAALENIDPSDNFSLTLFDESWHQGVIGILASRLKDKFHRPAIAFARAGNGELKGSGRSIAGLHLRDALDLVSKRHPSLIKKFGGHAAAAGLSIIEPDLNRFVAAFEKVAGELLSAGDLAQRIETDGALDPADMNLEVARALDAQVWGQGFPAPQFNDDFIVQNQRVVGEKHLKLRLSNRGKLIEAILFGHAEPLPEQIHAVYSLSINEYNGNQSLQLIVRHWRDARGSPG